MSSCILVTGGAGYIGSITTIELIKAGYEVVILDSLVNAKKGLLRMCVVLCVVCCVAGLVPLPPPPPSPTSAAWQSHAAHLLLVQSM